MEKEAKKIVRRFRFAIVLTILAICLVFTAAYFLMEQIAIIVFLLGFFIEPWILRKIKARMIYSIQLTRLDSELFYNVVHEAKIKPYYLAADLFVGNFKRVVSDGVANLRSDIGNVNKSVLLMELADVYFLVGDHEKLRAVLSAYESVIQRESFPIKKDDSDYMLFLKNFLDENYTECLGYCSNKNVKNNSQDMYNTLRTSLVFYRMGEAEIARDGFEHILKNAPKAGVARLAEKGIEALDSERDYSSLFEEILPEENYVSLYHETKKKANRRKRIGWALCGLALVVMIVSLFLPEDVDNEAVEALEAAEKIYDDVEIIEIVHLYRDGERTDNVCVVRTSEGIVAGELYWYDGEDDAVFDPVLTMPENLADQFVPVWFDIVETNVSNEPIIYGFSSDKGSLTQGVNVTIVEFEEDGKTYYFFACFADQFAEE